MEALETRTMLSASEPLNEPVSQAETVVDQYASAAEEQYLASAQNELQSALEAFLADTAASSSTVGVDDTAASSSLGAFSSLFESAMTGAASDSQQALDGANTTEAQAVESVSTTTNMETGSTSSGSLFASDADLQSFADNLATTAFGSFSSSGMTSSPSTSSGTGTNTTSGVTSSSGSTTTSSAASSGGSGGTGVSGSDSGSGSSAESGSGSQSGDASGSSVSDDESDENAASASWTPFALPPGVEFAEVHLPAEEFASNLRLLQPSGAESFSHTTITETSAAGITTRQTVTHSQTYQDAEHWVVSQSWTNEYTIEESSGDPENGAWSQSVRQGVTTFSITVSLGFGVPERPQVAKWKTPATSGGSTSLLNTASVSAPAPANFSNTAATTTTSLVPVGPVSTIAFSTSDSLSKSVGDSKNDSDPTTGKVDQGGYSGSSSAAASKFLALTEFDTLLPDGSLVRKLQLTSADDRLAGLAFQAGNELFEADGTVLDADGNPTDVTTAPFGTPFNSPGDKPVPDAGDVAGGTAPATPLGGNGSRVQAGAGLNVSSSFSNGSYFLADATTAIGAELTEADITGTAGMYTNYDGNIGVRDSFSFDSQESDATTGNFDYLSVGWSQSANASRGLKFSYELSLDDADLPDDPPVNSTPYTPDAPPPTLASTSGTPPSGSTTGSSSTVTGGSTSGFTGGTTSGSTPDPGTASFSGSGGSGTSAPASTTPALGKPVIDLDSYLSNSGNDKVWVLAKTDKTWFTAPNPDFATSTIYTNRLRQVTAVRMGGSSEISVTAGLAGWTPTATVTAKGDLNVGYVHVSVATVDWGGDTAVPPGYSLVLSEKQHLSLDVQTVTAAVNFDLSLTLTPTAAPAMTGFVDFTLDAERIAELHAYVHEKIVNNSNPADLFESWKRQNSVSRSLTTTTGGVGGVANALTTTIQTWTYSGAAESTVGDPPPPVPPAPATDILTTGLDYLQTGLDVAGLAPVIGEGADLLNAGIHLGRGNAGQAMLSTAAMIPFAGAGVTLGKFGNKIGKALGKNADKLDEAGDGLKRVCDVNCFVAGTPVVVAVIPPKRLVAQETHREPVSPEQTVDPLAIPEMPRPVIVETPPENHAASVTFAVAGVALALMRRFWKASSPIDCLRKRRQKRFSRQPASRTSGRFPLIDGPVPTVASRLSTGTPAIKILAMNVVTSSRPTGFQRLLSAAMVLCFAMAGWSWMHESPARTQQAAAAAPAESLAATNTPATSNLSGEPASTQAEPRSVTRNIEDMRLGQRLVGRNPLRHETSSPSEINPTTWRAVRLTMLQSGVFYELAFLRSIEWLEAANAQAGKHIDLIMPEMGLLGPALVQSIEPCPTIEPDDGTDRMIVTGTMKHLATNVLNLTITGLNKPLGVTTTHPIWSEDRHAFVPAGQLEVGEHLKQLDGTLTQVTRITPKRGPPELVYNLEVDAEHVYHVATTGLLVHNACPVDAAFGLDGHVQPFREALTAAGHRVDGPPVFASLTDSSDNLEQGLRHAMERSRRNHVTMDGFRQDTYDSWVKSGGPGTAPIPGGGNVTNWELHTLFNEHLPKTSFYSGPGSNFIPWPF